MGKYALVLHGGAGTILKSEMNAKKEAAYKGDLSKALSAGNHCLKSGGSAIEAVSLAVTELEDSPLFNAGRGSVFNSDKGHEMDASIMEGKGRNAGAAAQITGVRNPILLAKKIMEASHHILLTGKGAEKFGKLHNLKFEDEDYFYDEYRFQQLLHAKKSGGIQLDHSPLDEKKFGTVGAVALDQNGNLAAATSTGGMTNKEFGRVGDSPIIGAGTFADNRFCAVSCTGSGEYFMRVPAAYRVAVLMEMKGYSIQEACAEVVHESLKEIGGDGGLIAIDREGKIVMDFNTEGMYRASQSNDEAPYIGIYGA